jgi:hypothetical protein
MSRSQMPPVPPENRSRRDPADGRETPRDTSVKKGPPENPAQQGRQGNITQNTHHQGYQQDR